MSATKEGYAYLHDAKDKANTRIWLKLQNWFLYLHYERDTTFDLKPFQTIDLTGCVCEVDILQQPHRIRVRGKEGNNVNLAFSFKDDETLRAWRRALRDCYDFLFLQSLEPSHQSLVQKLKSSIGESTFVRIPTMYKYLAAHSFQLEEALAAIHQTATFRQQIGAKTIHEEVVHSLIVDGLVVMPGTCDIDGKPILIFKAAKYWPGKYKFFDVLLLVVYLLEKASDIMVSAHQICLIEQLQDAKRSNSDPRMVKFLVEVHQAYYPDMVANYFAVNAPWFYPLLLAIVKPWLPSSLSSKLHVYTSARSLTKYIEPSSLIEELGGSLKYDPYEMAKLLRTLDQKLAEHTVDELLIELYDDRPAGVTSAKAVMSGVIKKQGSWVRMYNKRYVVLTDRILYYYKNNSDSVAEGVLLLKGATLQRSSGTTFTITTSDGKKGVFDAGSKDEAYKWVSAIQEVITSLTKASS